MKKSILTIAIALVFLVGLGVLLYPYVADWYNNRQQQIAVADFIREIQAMDETDFSEYFARAQEYNEALLQNPGRFTKTEEERESYMQLLNPLGTGVMGILLIDKIDVRLPIYHGTREAVLQVGAGHLEGTSLPIGGLDTHTAISGHRGLPSSTLLTNLDQMEPGDTFTLQILNRILTYKVDDIIIVEPHELEALAIYPGMDRATLVTCHPYGINSHRMLVRAIRTENPEIPSEEQAPHEEERPHYVTQTSRDYIFELILLAAGLLTVILVVTLLKGKKRRGKKR